MSALIFYVLLVLFFLLVLAITEVIVSHARRKEMVRNVLETYRGKFNVRRR